MKSRPLNAGWRTKSFPPKKEIEKRKFCNFNIELQGVLWSVPRMFER